MRLAHCLIACLALLPTGCTAQNTPVSNASEPPPAPREFRAAWVATVANIDWPSEPGLSTAEQQREIIQILDRCEALNMNAVILQVRTSGDAFYDSKLEPWSEYLTGKQGQPPSPFYDPLQFWIDESHKRGIELHAWFNPFRAKVGAGRSGCAPTHISNTRPDLVKEYGKYLWLDPGFNHAEDHTFKVFMDVVERYDVDGIHIDDYFYPYPEKVNEKDEEDKRMIPFPDDDSYGAYQSTGGKLGREDWRRDNINQMMKRVYAGIKERKRWVQYGISPFGIARPGKPSYVKGFDQYDKIYADAELWFKEGWCDYLVPQLYWPIGAPQQPFLGLLQWWTTNNPKQRHLYAGLFTSRIDFGEKSWCPSEILGQVMITRLVPGGGGNVHFSMKALAQNRQGLADQLKAGLYAEDALAPETTWLGGKAPDKPRDVAVDRVSPEAVQGAMPNDYVDKSAPAATRPATRPFLPLTTQPTKLVEKLKNLGGVRVTWKSNETGEPVWQYAIYAKKGDTWPLKVLPASQTEVIIRDSADEKSQTTAVAVSAVDRLGHESARTVVTLPAAAKAAQ